MDFKSLCQARYSVRAYKPDAIPAEKLEYIKECTRLAPAAVNRQPWKFTLFTAEEDRARLQQCYDREWFREAPAYVLACENRGEAWTRRYDEKNQQRERRTQSIDDLERQFRWQFPQKFRQQRPEKPADEERHNDCDGDSDRQLKQILLLAAKPRHRLFPEKTEIAEPILDAVNFRDIRRYRGSLGFHNDRRFRSNREGLQKKAEHENFPESLLLNSEKRTILFRAAFRLIPIK